MKSDSDVQADLFSGAFEFSRHALQRSAERNISSLEIQEAGAAIQVIERYPDVKSADSSNQCHLCGGKRFEEIYTDEIFKVGEKHVLVEHIPANRCRNCGELTFSKETTERVRLLLHESHQPARTLTVDVFDLATA